MTAGGAHCVPPFLKRLQLQPDESVPSIVQRHCEANRARRMLDVLRLIEAQSGERIADVREIALSDAALQAVEWLTGMTEGTLASRYVHPLQGTHLVTGHHVWRRATHISRRQAICPLCIASAQYGRIHWEYAQAPVCVEHRVALIESCPSCSTSLKFSRTRIAHCGECGFALKDAAPDEVSEAVCRAAKLVQNPAMVAMGHVNSTAPIDGEDLSDLLRLCLPPRHGRPCTYGLEGHPGDLPLVDRVRALERLGSALDDRRIDSTKVQALILQRWPIIEFLPEASKLATLLQATSEMEMDPEVVRLLCHGDEANRLQRASEVFSKHPPQLATERDVATFLGIDLHVLRQLTGRGELHLGEDDVGFDMDHVLSIRERLSALCHPAQLDVALGDVGLSVALVELKLVTGVHSETRALLGVDPCSLATLVSRIQSVIDTQSAEVEDSVPIASAKMFGMEARDIAWVISQVASGSLRACEWPMPRQLMDLRVDGRRLLEIVEQVMGESRRPAQTGGFVSLCSEELVVNASKAASFKGDY